MSLAAADGRRRARRARVKQAAVVTRFMVFPILSKATHTRRVDETAFHIEARIP